MKRLCLLAISIFFVAVKLSAQPSCSVRTFTVRDGLPSNAITIIRQDSRGLIWIATWNGLCCYDGNRFTTFHGEPWGSGNALSSQRISAIEPDSQGNIWVRTYDGSLYLFDTRKCQYVNVGALIEKRYGQPIQSRNIYSLPSGHTWITDEGGHLNLRIDDSYPTDVARMEVFGTTGKPINGKYVRKVETDAQGREWIVTDVGMTCYGSGEFRPGVFTNYPDDTVAPVESDARAYVQQNAVGKHFIDRQGNLWAYSQQGVSLVNFHRHPMRLLPVEPKEQTRSVVARTDGTILAGTYGGFIGVFTADGHPAGWLTPQGTVANDTVHFADRIYAMREDRQGRLWIGTRGSGLYVLAPGSSSVRNYRHSAADSYSLSADDVYDICQDELGHIWIATYGGGVNLVEEKPSGDGTLRFLHSGTDLRQYPAEGFDKVRRITQDGRGTLLAATTSGLLTFPSRVTVPSAITFHVTTHVPSDTTSLQATDVMQALVARDGRVYVATMGGGIQQVMSSDLLCDRLSLQSVPVMNQGSGNALSMTEDRQGNIWITRESEVNLYNATTGRLEQFGPNNMAELTELTEALPAVDIQGNLWMGTMGGVLTFSPSEMRKSDYRPNIVFTTVRFQGEQNSHPILNNQVISVDSREQRNLTVSFAALDYEDNYLMQYAYRIKETGGGWNYIGNDPHIAFSQLPAGRHTLVVKSTNSDGVWVDNETEIIIDVKPMLWERMWVRLLALLLAVVIATTIVLIWLRHRRKLHEREQRLDNILRQYRELQEQLEAKETEKTKTNQREYRLDEPQVVDADDTMMNTLMAFIEQHVGDEELKIDDMADAVGMSRTVFYNKVKELVGLSPSDFLRQVRMQRAEQLVAKSRMTISEIAYAVGFTDPKYFAKCFKKQTGMTPTEFRTKE